MKRDNNFYYIFTMICFVVIYVTSFILTCRTISAGRLVATASIIIYPMTYFLGILFAERYGKDKYVNLIIYSVVSLILCAVLVTCASFLPIKTSDGLGALFNVNYRVVFAFVIAFLVGQLLNVTIYYFLDKKRAFNFLVASVISITIDSLLFVSLSYIGTCSFSELIQIFSGQYVLSVVMMILYSCCFAYLINTVITTKSNKEELENILLERSSTFKSSDVKFDNDDNKVVDSKVEKTEEVKKAPTKKKSVTKDASKSTSKKSATKTNKTSKSTVKKTTTKQTKKA